MVVCLTQAQAAPQPSTSRQEGGAMGQGPGEEEDEGEGDLPTRNLSPQLPMDRDLHLDKNLIDCLDLIYDL